MGASIAQRRTTGLWRIECRDATRFRQGLQSGGRVKRCGKTICQQLYFSGVVLHILPQWQAFNPFARLLAAYPAAMPLADQAVEEFRAIYEAEFG